MIKAKFNVLDCTYISLAKYKWFVFMFPDNENIDYSFKLNHKKEKIYFAKDNFIEKYENNTIYNECKNWQDKYDNY